MAQRVIPFEPAPAPNRLRVDQPRPESPWVSKSRAWINSHRPAEKHVGRSWFVILAAICIGVAMVFEPGYFVALAGAFALLGWWRRESAREGLLQVAIGALILGFVAFVGAVLVYFITPLFG